VSEFKQRLALYPLPMPFISPTLDTTTTTAAAAAAASNSKL